MQAKKKKFWTSVTIELYKQKKLCIIKSELEFTILLNKQSM